MTDERRKARRRRDWRLPVLCLAALLIAPGCERDAPESPVELTPLQRAAAALTATRESESFVFHFQPGDGARAEVDRSEAYHRWAVRYLGITPPKRIDFYMFPSNAVMQATIEQQAGGRAYPAEFAVTTAFSWHNHECMHLYTNLLGQPPRILDEGMCVAHEYDPYNDAWVSRWNRQEPYQKPHFEIARDLKEGGWLYPLESILQSDDFNRRVAGETFKIAYEEAGAWVGYLVETYGIERMKELIAALPYAASRERFKERFLSIYGLSVADTEPAWLAWLDRWQGSGLRLKGEAAPGP